MDIETGLKVWAMNTIMKGSSPILTPVPVVLTKLRVFGLLWKWSAFLIITFSLIGRSGAVEGVYFLQGTNDLQFVYRGPTLIEKVTVTELDPDNIASVVAPNSPKEGILPLVVGLAAKQQRASRIVKVVFVPLFDPGVSSQSAHLDALIRGDEFRKAVSELEGQGIAVEFWHKDAQWRKFASTATVSVRDLGIQVKGNIPVLPVLKDCVARSEREALGKEGRFGTQPILIFLSGDLGALKMDGLGNENFGSETISLLGFQRRINPVGPSGRWQDAQSLQLEQERPVREMRKVGVVCQSLPLTPKPGDVKAALQEMISGPELSRRLNAYTLFNLGSAYEGRSITRVFHFLVAGDKQFKLSVPASAQMVEDSQTRVMSKITAAAKSGELAATSKLYPKLDEVHGRLARQLITQEWSKLIETYGKTGKLAQCKAVVSAYKELFQNDGTLDSVCAAQEVADLIGKARILLSSNNLDEAENRIHETSDLLKPYPELKAKHTAEIESITGQIADGRLKQVILLAKRQDPQIARLLSKLDDAHRLEARSAISQEWTHLIETEGARGSVDRCKEIVVAYKQLFPADTSLDAVCATQEVDNWVVTIKKAIEAGDLDAANETFNQLTTYLGTNPVMGPKYAEQCRSFRCSLGNVRGTAALKAGNLPQAIEAFGEWFSVGKAKEPPTRILKMIQGVMAAGLPKGIDLSLVVGEWLSVLHSRNPESMTELYPLIGKWLVMSTNRVELLGRAAILPSLAAAKESLLPLVTEGNQEGLATLETLEFATGDIEPLIKRRGAGLTSKREEYADYAGLVRLQGALVYFAAVSEVVKSGGMTPAEILPIVKATTDKLWNSQRLALLTVGAAVVSTPPETAPNFVAKMAAQAPLNPIIITETKKLDGRYHYAVYHCYLPAGSGSMLAFDVEGRSFDELGDRVNRHLAVSTNAPVPLVMVNSPDFISLSSAALTFLGESYLAKRSFDPVQAFQAVLNAMPQDIRLYSLVAKGGGPAEVLAVNPADLGPEIRDDAKLNAVNSSYRLAPRPLGSSEVVELGSAFGVWETVAGRPKPLFQREGVMRLGLRYR